MTRRRLIVGGGVLLACVLVIVIGFTTYWRTASPERTCASCHEIESAHEMWAESPHREIPCAECHGAELSSIQHAVAHFGRQPGEEIRLSERQVIATVHRCRACHAREYADWLSGGHSATYADLFLDEAHNRAEQPTESCLRCHGMFFEGTIADVVTPLDTAGPWRLVDAERASVSAIPCPACHHVHAEGTPAVRPDYSDPASIAAGRRPRAATVAFYDRYERTYFEASELPTLELFEGGVAVRVAADLRQRVCVQCHAPNAFREAGSADDRTPRGVHEGLSCGACHAAHSNDASGQCANCHPQLSNCGLDVDSMNTSHRDPGSPNNIHFVACEDCHSREFLRGRTSRAGSYPPRRTVPSEAGDR